MCEYVTRRTIFKRMLMLVLISLCGSIILYYPKLNTSISTIAPVLQNEKKFILTNDKHKSMSSVPTNTHLLTESKFERNLSTDTRKHCTDTRTHSTDNRKHSTDNRNNSTDNRIYSTDNRKHSTDNRKHSTDNRTHSTDNRTHSIDNRKHSNDNRNHSTDTKQHILLHWNSPSWVVNNLNFNKVTTCVYNNCIFSYDRTLLNRSSAVLFSVTESGMEDEPPVHADRRNPNQTWIFYSMEAAASIRKRPVANPSWKNVFNWSWTYQTGSDIFHPYGLIVPRTFVPKRNYSDIFSKKRKFAAWVVSNCKTQSRREDYVRILQQYVDVDIFGRCGQKTPPDLENYLNTNYKFYLGFENSLCKDYVTEKFFANYMLDVMVVARGTNNYTSYVPKGSFIDTADFASVTALAKYMKYLADNEDEYVKYLKIKDQYSYTYVTKKVLCTVCEKLNNLDKNRRVYSDAVQWFGPCISDIQDLKDDPSVFTSNTGKMSVKTNTSYNLAG